MVPLVYGMLRYYSVSAPVFIMWCAFVASNKYYIHTCFWYCKLF